MFAAHATKGGVGTTPTTLNPSDTAAGATLSGGNLILTGPSGNWGMSRSVASASGDVYCEFTIGSGGTDYMVGVSDSSDSLIWIGNGNGIGLSYNGGFGNLYHNGGLVVSGYLPFAFSDIISMFYSPSNHMVWFGKNGVWTGNPSARTGGYDTNTGTPLGSPVRAAVSCYDTAATTSVNFGATAFTYSIPTGGSIWS